MNILEFYLEQQKYPEWYKKFQSMAKDKSGKIFSYSSTTYRYMHNFIADVEKFYRLNGVPMDQWPTYEDGQKEDKQRTLPLSLANFVYRKEDRYFFTGAGYTCMDLISLDKTDNEEWLLLFLLLLDYRSEWRNNDIILTSKEYIKYLLNCGLNENDVLDQLENLQLIDNIEEVMKTDIFWLITFAKDKQFIEKYIASSDNEKAMLHTYVINEQKNKKSKDCIGHKFVAGGQMLPGQFIEECKTLYVAYRISKNKYETFDEMLEKLFEIYDEIAVVSDYSKIKEFIEGHLSIYEDIFNRCGLRSVENE